MQASTAALPALLQLLAQLPPAVSSVEAAPAESQAAFAEALGALSK